MRSNFLVILIVLGITIVSVLIGEYLGQPIIGWLLALAILLAVAYGSRYTLEQFVLSFILYLLLVSVVISSQPWGAVLGAAFGVVGFYVSALSVENLFTGTGIRSLDYVVRVFLGQLGETQVVEAPNAGVEEPAYRYGPRTVVVEPGAAVVTIRGSRFSRIQAAGIFVSQPMEYVQRVFNLQPIHRNYRFKEVLTNERTPLQVDVAIIYGIRVSIAARLGEVALTRDERENLRALIAWAPDWEAALREVVEKNIRRRTGLRTLREALTMDSQRRIQLEAMAATQTTVARWGLTLYELHVVSIQPDSTVVNASLENWLVALTTDTHVVRELGRGTAWARAINEIANAYREAVDLGVPNDVISRELVRRIFEQVAMDPSARSLLQGELSQMLARRDVDQPPP